MEASGNTVSTHPRARNKRARPGDGHQCDVIDDLYRHALETADCLNLCHGTDYYSRPKAFPALRVMNAEDDNAHKKSCITSRAYPIFSIR